MEARLPVLAMTLILGFEAVGVAKAQSPAAASPSATRSQAADERAQSKVTPDTDAGFGYVLAGAVLASGLSNGLLALAYTELGHNRQSCGSYDDESGGEDHFCGLDTGLLAAAAFGGVIAFPFLVGASAYGAGGNGAYWSAYGGALAGQFAAFMVSFIDMPDAVAVPLIIGLPALGASLVYAASDAQAAPAPAPTKAAKKSSQVRLTPGLSAAPDLSGAMVSLSGSF